MSGFRLRGKALTQEYERVRHAPFLPSFRCCITRRKSLPNDARGWTSSDVRRFRLQTNSREASDAPKPAGRDRRNPEQRDRTRSGTKATSSRIGTSMSKSEEYPAKAKECEERADSIQDLETESSWLHLAQQWRELAEDRVSEPKSPAKNWRNAQ